MGSFLQWRGHLGAKIKVVLDYQSFNVERTPGRFLETEFNQNNRLFSTQQFANLEAGYYYRHTDNEAFPTLGVEFETKLGYTTNLNESRNFGYNISSLAIDHKVIPNGKLVLASKVKGHFNFGNDFEFYQAANIGANEGLRGFRNERFNGKNSFVHTTDLRWNMSRFKTGLLPLSIGIYGGFDYGKVWGTPNDRLLTPNNITKLHTSKGGGVFFNAANMFVGSIGYFNSIDGSRLEFSLGFDF